MNKQIIITAACIHFMYIFNMADIQPDQRFWIEVEASSVEERTALIQKGLCIEEIGDTWVAGTIDALSKHDLCTSKCVIKKTIPLEEYIQDSLRTSPSYQFTIYPVMLKSLQKLTAEHNEILTLHSIGNSCEGRTIWMLHVTNKKNGKVADKPGILFVGNHHAREHLSTEVCLALAQHICNQKNSDSIKELLDSINIYIIPMLNPDGTDYDLNNHSYACWRKNRHINQDKTIGVDLNRNYDYVWSSGNSVRMGSETYGGAYPFSEPETLAIKNFLGAHKNIRIFISYHSYGKQVLYPWGCTRTPIENVHDRNMHIQLAQKIAQITGYKALQASALYVAPGDAVDWAYGKQQTCSLTIELMPQHAAGCGAFYPSDKQAINNDIEKNIQAALYACGVCGNSY